MTATPPVSYSTITNRLSVNELGWVSYRPLVLAMLNTIKPSVYIPIFCIFRSFMHFCMALARSPIRTIVPKFYTLTDIVTLLHGPHKYEKFEFCCIWVPLLQLVIYHSIYQQDY